MRYKIVLKRFNSIHHFLFDRWYKAVKVRNYIVRDWKGVQEISIEKIKPGVVR